MTDEYEGLSPTFADACRKTDAEYRRKGRPTSIIDQILDAPSDWAAYQIAFHSRRDAVVAASTLQAAEFLWRTGDRKRLETWLREHNNEEIGAILEHLERKYANRSE